MQVLLVACQGSLARSLPVMGAAYWSILMAWLASVDNLAKIYTGANSTEAAH